ncbi:dehydratase [Actinobacillus suis H91-0380]|uniref:Dehydratase n=2 Tax=Actinobacillus suis TaxID=716 RepID=K0G6R6_ACTSU|nr:dehydratase [Actinobacillus suis]AFU20051.1 dehydratase [Actinobacillus suis H91-0380]AIJ32190.1 dehydratase [Actinobacillus suis ATCC 33415]SNV39399.1 dehydratase [Actinobacillus suis]
MDFTLPIENVAPLVPQSGEMVLIDRVTDFGEDFLTGEAEIRSNHILLKAGKLQTFAGIEIMAQGIAAWAGIQARKRNEPVRLGYLLGTRKLYITQPEIAVGSQLMIEIKMSIQDATGFGVFDCRLIDKVTHQTLLSGALNVFSPKDGKIQK